MTAMKMMRLASSVDIMTLPMTLMVLWSGSSVTIPPVSTGTMMSALIMVRSQEIVDIGAVPSVF